MIHVSILYKKKDRRLFSYFLIFIFSIVYTWNLLVENDDAVKRKAGIVKDGLVRLTKKPRIEMVIVAQKVHDGNDVVMRLRIDHEICGERIGACKDLVDGIIDVGILGDRKGLVGGEEALEEGENGRHGWSID